MDSKIIWSFFFFLGLHTSCSLVKSKDKEDVLSKPDCHFPLGATMSNQETKKVVVYKTNKDFSSNVPIILNESKDVIVGYPSPTDFSKNLNGKNVIRLNENYLMDLIGISKNSVFTSFELDKYITQELPTLKSFKENIIELNPIVELYYCDAEFTESDLNRLIRNKHLVDSCLRVK